MASTAPPGGAQSQPQSTSPNEAPLSWEGDRMFNIYIYDYCNKRGFKKTARELLAEAEIPADSKPPINARQGLLFEWWSVFWVLFSAKANGNGTEDAMLYTQHQTSQVMQRQLQQQRMQPPTQGPIPGAPVGQPGGHQQPVTRILNGPLGQRLGGPPFGPMPNGVPPGPGPFPNLGGPGPQPNGIPHQAPGSTSAQPQNFASLLPNQRPLGTSGGPQQGPQPPPQRQNGPFHPSPTMANSPQAGQGQQQQQTTPQQQAQQHPQTHGQPPMGQLGAPGPSPHMQHLNRAMPPPQGLNPLNPGVQQSGNTPNPAFAQLGRPPSRATTPGGQPNMMHPSPSLSARQMGGGGIMQGNPELMELRQIPMQILQSLRAELGLGDRDINQMTPAEKGRLVNAVRQRRVQKPDGSGPLQHPNPQLRGIPQPPQQTQPRLKRSSTTPEEQHDGLRNDSSPPQKRQRPSPEQAPMQGIGFPPHHPQQGPPGAGPQLGQSGMPMPGQNSLMLMRGPTQIGGPMGGVSHGGHPPMGNPMNMNLGQQQLGGSQLGGVSMNPQHPVGHPGMNPQLQLWQQQQYRIQMQALKGPLPPQAMNPAIQGPGNNSAVTPSTDPALHPGAPGGPQFNRMPPQNKPMGMMPPPSPAQNGANKDQGGSKDGKPDDASRSAPGNAGQTPNAGGTAPTTPAPGPGPQGPPQTNGAPNTSITPSSSSILGAPLNAGPLVNQQSVENLFQHDFMQHLSNSLDDFDSNIFRNDGDINFERDFGQWFNGDDAPLDLK